MDKIRIVVFGSGKTGRIIANEFLNDGLFTLAWVVRRGREDHLNMPVDC